GDHLFFGKPALLHDFLFSVGSHSLKFQLVRKFQGRSDRIDNWGPEYSRVWTSYGRGTGQRNREGSTGEGG
ncbi:hypothetical protein, partial [Burkholderia pseudomallei]